MKIAIYDSLEKIPEADRDDYKLVSGKYVLDLDPQHPVAIKNTELLAEKSQRDIAQQAAAGGKSDAGKSEGDDNKGNSDDGKSDAGKSGGTSDGLPTDFPMEHVFSKPNKLSATGFKTVAEIQAYSRDELISIDGIGETSADKALAYGK